jgi:hypothetical protein
MRPQRIYFNAFHMNCVVHQSPGLWVHPQDQMHRYTDLHSWIDLAKLLERGKFDGLFLADALGVYDVYRNNREAAVTQATQIPANDPMVLVSAMAYATEHLGFAFTSSVLQSHPFPFARQISTLDHLTKGRIGWNVVTSHLESGARNMGQAGLPPHDERYEIAEEYVDVCYKLWEASWEDGAVIKDRQRGIYADPAKVHVQRRSWYRRKKHKKAPATGAAPVSDLTRKRVPQVNEQQIFVFLKQKSAPTLLDLLQHAYRAMTVTQRQTVFDAIVKKILSSAVDGKKLLKRVKQFHRDSLAGKYDAPFDINSKNY